MIGLYVFNSLFRSDSAESRACDRRLMHWRIVRLYRHELIVFVIIIIHVIFLIFFKTSSFHKFSKTSFLFLYYFRFENQHRFRFR